METVIYEFLTINKDLIVVKSDLPIDRLINFLLKLHNQHVISHTLLDNDEVTEDDIDYFICKF